MKFTPSSASSLTTIVMLCAAGIYPAEAHDLVDVLSRLARRAESTYAADIWPLINALTLLGVVAIGVAAIGSVLVSGKQAIRGRRRR